MKKSKFSEVQIIKILSEQNQGKTVNKICREHGISQPTFYKWKRNSGRTIKLFFLDWWLNTKKQAMNMNITKSKSSMVIINDKHDENNTPFYMSDDCYCRM